MDLGHRRIVRAGDQRVDREILRADAVERRRACRRARDKRPLIACARSSAHRSATSVTTTMMPGSRPRIGAHRAGILRIDIAADAADLDLLERGLQRGGERRHDLLALLDQEQRSAPRRARAEGPAAAPSNWISRSISGPATAVGIAGQRNGCLEQLQPGRQRQAAGDRLHLLLHHRLGLCGARPHGPRPRDPRRSRGPDGFEQVSSILMLFISPLPLNLIVTMPAAGPPLRPRPDRARPCIASILDLSSAACSSGPGNQPSLASCCVSSALAKSGGGGLPFRARAPRPRPASPAP